VEGGAVRGGAERGCLPFGEKLPGLLKGLNEVLAA